MPSHIAGKEEPRANNDSCGRFPLVVGTDHNTGGISRGSGSRSSSGGRSSSSSGLAQAAGKHEQQALASSGSSSSSSGSSKPTPLAAPTSDFQGTGQAHEFSQQPQGIYQEVQELGLQELGLQELGTQELGLQELGQDQQPQGFLSQDPGQDSGPGQGQEPDQQLHAFISQGGQGSADWTLPSDLRPCTGRTVQGSDLQPHMSITVLDPTQVSHSPEVQTRSSDAQGEAHVHKNMRKCPHSHVHTHAHMKACALGTRTQLHTRLPSHSHMHTHAHTCTKTNIQTFSHTLMYMNMHTHMHTHTHITHTHTLTHTLACHPPLLC